MQKKLQTSPPQELARSREPAAAPTGVSSVKGQATLTVKLGPGDAFCLQTSVPTTTSEGRLSRQGNSTCLAIKSPGSLQGSKRMSPGLYHNAELLLKCDDRASLGVQWLKLSASNAGGAAEFPGGKVRPLYTQL